MKLGSVSENLSYEKRISITPEIAIKYIKLGFEVYLNSNYGKHLCFNDEAYKQLNVKILKTSEEVIKINEYKTLPGDYCVGVIPDPIPNSEVKSFSADGTLS